MSGLSPLERANSKSALYMMDVISYIMNSMDGLEEDSDCKGQKGAKCTKIWQGKDPAKNIPSYLNPVLKKLPAIFPELSSNPDQNEVDSKLLYNLANDSDLKNAVAKIDASSLTPKEKARAKAALYLMDVIGYIVEAMGGLENEKECKEVDGANCSDIWSGQDPYAKVPGKIKPSAATLKKLFSLAKKQDPAKMQEVLENQYLIDPSSNADLKIALCSLDPQNSYCPAISDVKPGEAKQGKPAVIVIEGSNFLADTKVQLMLDKKTADDKISILKTEVAPGKITLGVNVAGDAQLGARSVIISAAEGRVSAQKADAFSVVKADLPPYCDDGIDNDKDGKVDAADPDCAAGGLGEMEPTVVTTNSTEEEASTKMQIAAYWLQKKLKLQVPVQLGGGDILAKDLNDAPVWNRAAIETTNNPPNVKAGISVNPTIVGKEEDALVKYDPLTLKANARFNYAGYLQNKASHLLDAGAGFELKLNTDHYVAPSVYFQWDLNQNDYAFPNKWFYNGMSNQLTPGLALTHEAGKYLPKFPFRATLFSEYRHTIFNWDQKTQGYEFSGIDQAVWMGGELVLPFTKLGNGKHGAVPDLTIRAAGILGGQHEVPEVIGTLIGSSFEQMNGWEMEGKLQWNNSDPYKPYLRAGYRSLDLKGWPSVSEAFWGLGVYAPDAGQFEVQGSSAWNITPYYDESQSFSLLGSWTPTEDWLDGRLSAFTVNLGFNLTKDMDQKGYNQLYGFVGVDMIKLVTGKAPDKLVYASDKPAAQPAAEPQPHPAVKPPKPAPTDTSGAALAPAKTAAEFDAKKYLEEQCNNIAGTDAAKCASSYKGDNTKANIDSYVEVNYDLP